MIVSRSLRTHRAIALVGMVVATCAVLPFAVAGDSKYYVDYTEEIDLLSSYNRPITLSLLPKQIKGIDYYPDDAIFPCTTGGVTIQPTRNPPRKCHYLTAVVGDQMPSFIFILDGQQITAILREEFSTNRKSTRKLLHSWESDRANAPMVNGPNPALYQQDHRQ